MAHHILDFRLDVDLKTFLETFWFSNEFYLKYMTKNLLDREVVIGEWTVPVSGDGETSKVRHVQSQHPCKVSVCRNFLAHLICLFSSLGSCVVLLVVTGVFPR